MLLIFFSVVYSFCYGVFSESFGLDKTIMKPIIGLSNMHQYIDLLYPICL